MVESKKSLCKSKKEKKGCKKKVTRKIKTKKYNKTKGTKGGKLIDYFKKEKVLAQNGDILAESVMERFIAEESIMQTIEELIKPYKEDLVKAVNSYCYDSKYEYFFSGRRRFDSKQHEVDEQAVDILQGWAKLGCPSDSAIECIKSLTKTYKDHSGCEEGAEKEDKLLAEIGEYIAEELMETYIPDEIMKMKKNMIEDVKKEIAKAVNSYCYNSKYQYRSGRIRQFIERNPSSEKRQSLKKRKQDEANQQAYDILEAWSEDGPIENVTESIQSLVEDYKRYSGCK